MEWHKVDSLIPILNIWVKDLKVSRLVPCLKIIKLHRVIKKEEVNLMELKIKKKML